MSNNDGQDRYQRAQFAGGGPELVGQMQGNLESDAAFRQRLAQQAEIDRVEKIVARDMAVAYSARQEQVAREPKTEMHQQFDAFRQRAAEATLVGQGGCVAPKHMEAFASEQMGAHAAKQAQDGPHGVTWGQVAQDPVSYVTGPARKTTGEAAGYGVAQMLRAPGKMFSRSDILAILRAARVDFTQDSQRTVLAFLLHTFENLE